MSKEKLEKQLAEAEDHLAALKRVKASADEIELIEDEKKELKDKIKSAPASEKKTEPAKKGAVSVRTSTKKVEVKKPAENPPNELKYSADITFAYSFIKYLSIFVRIYRRKKFLGSLYK